MNNYEKERMKCGEVITSVNPDYDDNVVNVPELIATIKDMEAELAEKDREIERLKEHLEHSEIERKQMELFMRKHT